MAATVLGKTAQANKGGAEGPAFNPQPGTPDRLSVPTPFLTPEQPVHKLASHREETSRLPRDGLATKTRKSLFMTPPRSPDQMGSSLQTEDQDTEPAGRPPHPEDKPEERVKRHVPLNLPQQNGGGLAGSPHPPLR